ncbi:MAG: hypothetical protein AAFX80_21525 [Cyanobacteria bacterium J06639_18]
MNSLSVNVLSEQLQQHLDLVLAGELAKLIGKDNFDRITQAWLKEGSFVRSHDVEEILNEMKIMGIKIDDELESLLESVTPIELRNAFDAYKEALKEERVKHHEKFLKAAIKNKYVPNYQTVLHN